MPVPFAADRLDEAGLIGIILQGLSEVADSGVDAGLGVDEDVLAPETVDDFLAGDDVGVFFGEKRQQLHRNTFELQHQTVAPQLEARAVELEFAERMG
jgi:hypothetical protein